MKGQEDIEDEFRRWIAGDDEPEKKEKHCIVAVPGQPIYGRNHGRF